MERESDRPNPGQGKAILAGVGVALAGALAWGLLGAYAEYQIWALAIAIGIAIGFVTVKTAQRVTLPMQVGVVLLTVGSVVLGEILTVAFLINRELEVFDIGNAASLYFDNLDDYEVQKNFFFALGGGAIGAYYSVRMTRRPAPPPQAPAV